MPENHLARVDVLYIKKLTETDKIADLAWLKHDLKFQIYTFQVYPVDAGESEKIFEWWVLGS